MSKNTINNLIVVLSSFLIVILFLEIFTRVFYPQNLQKYWTEQEKKYGLEVNKKNYFHKLHRFKNNSASYTFGKFNNRNTLKKNNLNNLNKILVLGDSFAFGYLVEDEKTFVHKLQLDNLDYNFINVSVGAWGTSQYTLFTELNCKEIKPKKIFVILNTDDAFRGYNSGLFKLTDDGELKNSRVVDRKLNEETDFEKNIPLYKFLKSNSHLFMLLRNIIYDLKVKPTYNPWSKDRYWPRPNSNFDNKISEDVKNFNFKIFLRLNEISKKCKSELIIFYTNWATPSMMKNSNPNKLFLENAENFFKKNDIKYFKNYKKMKNLYKDPMKYIIDIDFHPNSEGAELIYNSLKDNVAKVLKD